MEMLIQPEEAYSRFSRHGRLHKLYRELGEADLAKDHLEACLRLSPPDPEVAKLWHGIFNLPVKAS